MAIALLLEDPLLCAIFVSNNDESLLFDGYCR